MISHPSSLIFPEPLRSIGCHIYNMYNADAWSTNNHAFKDALKKMGMIAFRVSLVATAFTAAIKLGYGQQPLVIAGMIVSVPATLIGSGAYYLYTGAKSIYHNLFVNRVFKEAGKGLATSIAGYLLLDLNDVDLMRGIYPGVCDGALSKMFWPEPREI